MPYSCTDCQGDIIEPWDGELTEDPHTCAVCEHPVCWDCKNMDTAGNDFCSDCAADHEKENPDAFNH